MKKSKNIIFFELNKRKDNKKRANNILGAEIKNSRLKHNLTLEEVAKDICSVSYLSKLENNAIEGNKHFVYRLCDKVYITESTTETIYKLDEILIKASRAFYLNDTDLLSGCYENVYNLDNYRSDIIILIYYIYFKEYKLAYNILEKVKNLIKGLTDFDLIYLAIFAGILDIKRNDFLSGIETLRTVYQKLEDEMLKALAKEYLMLGYYKVNSRRFLIEIPECIDYHIKYMQYDKVNELMFTQAKYYLQNDIYQLFYQIMETLKESKYYMTLKLIDDIYNLRTIDSNIDTDNFVSNFYEMIYLLYTNSSKFSIKLEMIKDELSDDEFLYLKYIETKIISIDEREKFSRLHDILGSAFKISSVALVSEIRKKVTKHYTSIKKYKEAMLVYEKCDEMISRLSNI